GLQGNSATQQALESGDISEEHADVIVRAGEKLPEDLTTRQRRQVEDDLGGKARQISPTALRRRARRQLEALNKDRQTVDADEERQVAEEEEQARAKCRLSMRDNGDGTVTGWFTLPVFQGHLLRKIIQTMTAPRRTNNTNSNHSGGGGTGTSGSGASGAAFGTSGTGGNGATDGSNGPPFGTTASNT